MLTEEQSVALQKACTLYEQAHRVKQDDLAKYLELVNDAFGELIEYIDDVDDIYYRVLFANCIDQLQNDGNIEFSELLLGAKAEFYIQTAMWFADDSTQSYNTYFTSHLFYAFEALGRMYLRGEYGVNQSDEAAYVAYTCIRLLNNPAMTEYAEMAYLSDFIKDEATGKIIFTGLRPQ